MGKGLKDVLTTKGKVGDLLSKQRKVIEYDDSFEVKRKIPTNHNAILSGWKMETRKEEGEIGRQHFSSKRGLTKPPIAEKMGD